MVITCLLVFLNLLCRILICFIEESMVNCKQYNLLAATSSTWHVTCEWSTYTSTYGDIVEFIIWLAVTRIILLFFVIRLGYAF